MYMCREGLWRWLGQRGLAFEQVPPLQQDSSHSFWGFFLILMMEPYIVDQSEINSYLLGRGKGKLLPQVAKCCFLYQELAAVLVTC